MDRDVHIEGMGVLGSLLARMLDRRGVSFTWHDTDAAVNAWSACTGCVYPGGSVHDEASHANWLLWHETLLELPTETARYWCNHKHPPHGGRYEWDLDLGWLRRASLPSVHLNAQELVHDTRWRFSGERRSGPRGAAHYVVAHGFTTRLRRYVWGWTVPVKLGMPEEMSSGERVALYLRKGRFVMVYAYPMPGTEWWYAGSSLIVQKEPKPLDVEAHFERWKLWLDELTGGRIFVTEREGAVEGWRPQPAVEDDELKVYEEPQGRLILPSMWHDGVRHFPVVAAQVMQKLGAL